MLYRRFYWVTVLLTTLTVASLQGSTISWTNSSGGLWSAPANWNTHFVPGPSDSVNITAAGTYTVTMDTNVSILNLTLGGGSGVQTLTNSTMTFSVTNMLVTANGIFSLGGGTLGGGGSATNQGTFNWGGGTVSIPLTVAGGGVLNFNGAAVNIYSPLTNAGTINWSGQHPHGRKQRRHLQHRGDLQTRRAGFLIFKAIKPLSSSGYGFELFSNAGIVRKTAGLGTSTFGLAFTNTGTVDAQSGTIQFHGGGNIGGTYNTASGATIQLPAAVTPRRVRSATRARASSDNSAPR